MSALSISGGAEEKPPGKKWLGHLCLWFGLALLSSVSAWVLWADWPNPKSDALPARVDVIIVLGGGAQERPRQAWKLFQEGRAGKIIVTGDGGLIVRALLHMGLPESALIHETKANSTLGNARETLPILNQMKAETAILVTTWSHARRAQRVFERAAPHFKFYSSFEEMPESLNIFERRGQRRERVAALYCLLRGIWCF